MFFFDWFKSKKPRFRPEIIEVAGSPPDRRLENHSILFEFHVTENDYARILARARFHGTQPEADSRWAAWRHLAIDHCLARPVQESGDPQSTKAVGKWDGGDFRLIKFNPPPDEQAVAQIIRSYLKNSPRSLLCFIANL